MFDVNVYTRADSLVLVGLEKGLEGKDYAYPESLRHTDQFRSRMCTLIREFPGTLLIVRSIMFRDNASFTGKTTARKSVDPSFNPLNMYLDNGADADIELSDEELKTLAVSEYCTNEEACKVHPDYLRAICDRCQSSTLVFYRDNVSTRGVGPTGVHRAHNLLNSIAHTRYSTIPPYATMDDVQKAMNLHLGSRSRGLFAALTGSMFDEDQSFARGEQVLLATHLMMHLQKAATTTCAGDIGERWNTTHEAVTSKSFVHGHNAHADYLNEIHEDEDGRTYYVPYQVFSLPVYFAGCVPCAHVMPITFSSFMNKCSFVDTDGDFKSTTLARIRPCLLLSYAAIPTETKSDTQLAALSYRKTLLHRALFANPPYDDEHFYDDFYQSHHIVHGISDEAEDFDEEAERRKCLYCTTVAEMGDPDKQTDNISLPAYPYMLKKTTGVADTNYPKYGIFTEDKSWKPTSVIDLNVIMFLTQYEFQVGHRARLVWKEIRGTTILHADKMLIDEAPTVLVVPSMLTADRQMHYMCMYPAPSPMSESISKSLERIGLTEKPLPLKTDKTFYHSSLMIPLRTRSKDAHLTTVKSISYKNGSGTIEGVVPMNSRMMKLKDVLHSNTADRIDTLVILTQYTSEGELSIMYAPHVLLSYRKIYIVFGEAGIKAPDIRELYYLFSDADAVFYVNSDSMLQRCMQGVDSIIHDED